MLSIQKYNRAVILPPYGEGASPKGGVVTSDGHYIASSCPNLGAGGRYIPPEIVESDETVIYLGWFNDVWGHTITDVLKKLWYVGTVEYKELISSGVKPVFITHYNEHPRNLCELLKYAGIDVWEFVRVDSPTQFKTVYIPDDCFVSYGDTPHFTQEYVDIIQRIKSDVPQLTNCPDKVYFSRTGLIPKFSWSTMYMYKEVNEYIIEGVFRLNGYTVIRPERLTFTEQLQYLIGCNHFASIEGSVSHNSVFCSPHTDVAIIQREDNSVANLYAKLTGEAAFLDITFLRCHASKNVTSTFYGPFYLCVTTDLERYFEMKIPHTPYWLQPLWWWYMLYNTFFGKAIQKILRMLNKTK